MGPPGNIATAQPIPDQPQPPKKSRFGGMGNTVSGLNYCLVVTHRIFSLRSRLWAELVLVLGLPLGVVSSIQSSRDYI